MKIKVQRILPASILTGALLFISATAFASLAPATDSIPKYQPGYFMKRFKADSLLRDSIRMARSLTTLTHDSIELANTDTLRNDTLLSQVTDTVAGTAPDTLSLASDTSAATVVKEPWIPSPQRATILSAVLPGLGQAYNRRYWKIPIIYIGGAALYWGYYEKNIEFQRHKREYNELKVTGQSTSGETNLKQAESQRDYARQRRDYYAIYIGILYVANVVDAMTDAYFRTYEISDDLTISLKPSIQTNQGFAHMDMNYGLKLSMKF